MIKNFWAIVQQQSDKQTRRDRSKSMLYFVKYN